MRKAIAVAVVVAGGCAAWALARVGDGQSAPGLLALVGATSGYSQAKATQACFRLAENVAAAGRKNEARELYDAIRRQTKEKYVRDIASKAIGALGPS